MGKEKRRDCHKKEFNVEELSNNIKNRINEKVGNRDLPIKETKEVRENISRTLEDIDNMLADIELYLKEESEENFDIELDLEQITNDVNAKLAELDLAEEDELEQTLYDLSEISSMIKETIDRLEKDKEKKRKKAMYCEQARRNKNNNNYKKYKHNKKNK